MRRKGLNQKAAMYDDWEKVADVMVDFHKTFEPDTVSGVFFMSGKSMEILGVTSMKWPGFNLPDNSPYQALEVENMKADEYDWFINDPSDFMLRAYLPRSNSALTGLKKLPRFSIDTMAGMSGFMAQFMLDSEVQEAFDRMKQSAELSQTSRIVSFKLRQRLTQSGFPSLSNMVPGGTGIPPYDLLGDNLRGTMGIMMDLFRQPENVVAACEKILSLLPEPDVPLGGSPLVMLPLHKGDDAHMSDQHFEKFYWPTFKGSLMKLINDGLIPMPFAEGSYNRRLEHIAELPKGSTVWYFDQTDLKRAKDMLAGKCCVMGNVPVSLVKTGTPGEITKYCEDLIDHCGRDGGFILSSGASIDDTYDENLKALINVTKNHLPS